MSLSSTDQLHTDLAGIVGSTNVLPPEDAPGYAIDDVEPAAVVAPPNRETLAAVLRYADTNGLALAPRGSGTRMGLGNPPARLDVVVLLRHFNRLLEHEKGDMTCAVEAGMRLVDLQAELAKKGQWLPLDPPHADSTVGGMVAANASGPRRAYFGTARDHILGIHALRADGVAFKAGGMVVKNVAGYDLNKLYCGSLGTLGILTRINFKLRPFPQGERMLLASFDAPEPASRACLKIFGTSVTPSAMEILNPQTRLALTRAGELPGPTGAWSAFFALEGITPVLDRQERDIRIACEAEGAEGLVVIPGEQAGAMWRVFRDLPAASADTPAAAVAVKVCVLPTNVPAALQATRELADHLDASVTARATAGILQIFGQAEGEDAEAGSLLRAAAERIRAEGGHFILEDAPLGLKQDFDVWGPTRSDFRIMEGLKKELDPNNILNPGRFVGGL